MIRHALAGACVASYEHVQELLDGSRRVSGLVIVTIPPALSPEQRGAAAGVQAP